MWSTRLHAHTLKRDKILIEILYFLQTFNFSKIDKKIASEILENIKTFNLICLQERASLMSTLTEEEFYLHKKQVIAQIKKVCMELNYEINAINIYETECNLKILKKEIIKEKCFIATAAMGDYNHPVVVDLRLFRDEWLLKRNWGVYFTNWYYTHGPKVADLIEKSNILKKITFYAIIKPLQVITKNLR